MSRCRECGSRCRGRYCRVCGPIARNADYDGQTEAEEVFLAESGPHKCDLCDSVVQVLDRLKADCEEHGQRVATDGGGEHLHYAEPGETVTLRNTVTPDREVTAVADRDGLVCDADHPRGFSADLWERVDEHMEVLPDGGEPVGENPDHVPHDGAMVEGTPEPPRRDPLADDFELGDPCIDLATGRTVVVTGLPELTVAEWSDNEDFDLLDVYGNDRCRASPNDPVVEAVYAASVQSEPSGPRGSDGAYTFPSARLARVEIEAVEGVRRVYDAVAIDVLRRLALEIDPADGYKSGQLAGLYAKEFGEVGEVALELANVDSVVGRGDDGE